MHFLRRLLLALLWLCPLLAAAQTVEFRLERLRPGVEASEASVLSGAQDGQFDAVARVALSTVDRDTWFRIIPASDWQSDSPPVLVVQQTRFQRFTVFPSGGGRPTTLSALQADFPGSQTRGVLIFPLGDSFRAGQPLYLQARLVGSPTRLVPWLSITSYDEARATALMHVRLSASCFAALMALALSSMCVWLLLRERLFILYAALVGCQALYVTLITYDAYSLPGLRDLLQFGVRTPFFFAVLACIAAIRFARSMTNADQFAPRIAQIFSAQQILFVLLVLVMLATPYRYIAALSLTGNVLILAGTLTVAAAAIVGWRHGSRASAFFLLAWLVMQGFTFARAFNDTLGVQSSNIIVYGFPLSMVGSGILLALGLADRVREMRAALHEAQARASTDALTGVLNRRSILERLDAARTGFRDFGEPVSVLFVDLDHFKPINDHHGHLAGDACLREASRRLVGTLRHSDAVGRYGGEEFLVVLRGVDRSAAAAIAEQLRVALASVPVHAEGAQIDLTCSIGVASTGSDALSAEDLIARADAALYAAKRDGRNRVALAPDSALVAPDPAQTEGARIEQLSHPPLCRTPR
ncbi:GGDEF domain-containing protein [Niveibacterium sp. 24ML]|uniref:sensor domain-containing diguanylate cyclase n=1 Tax=Niveibacterium sp. 24ML TaxID=2985512 RepID=UPI00226F04E7|nr:diguanylate cyclase [Niveibacterium sp. 24ML]MCX9157571.1 GGDEF domain-containing protein [Niveibacterium sp. 24ML]